MGLGGADRHRQLRESGLVALKARTLSVLSMIFDEAVAIKGSWTAPAGD
jgi:hypothetical protein